VSRLFIMGDIGHSERPLDTGVVGPLALALAVAEAEWLNRGRATVGRSQRTSSEAGEAVAQHRWWYVARVLVAVVLAGVAVGMGAVRASADDWLQLGFGPAHNGFNPNETTIGPANVASLHQVWRTANLFDEQQSQPIVAGGRLF